MEWAYGVTTVPERIYDLLPQTLEQLKKAGFDSPRIFLDGGSKFPPKKLDHYHLSVRAPRIRVQGNWYLAATELFIRQPNAQRYAIFQDDLLTYPNLREYLETCDMPDRGYWNLYTFPENERQFDGWYLSNQLGKGAVGLVFSNEGIQTLLTSRLFLQRPKNPQRGWKFVDGGVVDAMKADGWQEYVHNPSLVQHTGDVSSCGNGKHEKASTFQGVDFDARSLIGRSRVRVEAAPARRGRTRVGLVGYNCASGLGELNRQIVEYADIDLWLIKPHSKFPDGPRPQNVDVMYCRSNTEQKIAAFLKNVDVVLFCETPFFRGLAERAQQEGKRVVCVPMLEWMPSGAKGWPQHCSLHICPTTQCYNAFAHVVPCKNFTWPVDVRRFKFKQRERARKFLFVNGHGGYKGRKGGDVIRRAIELWPEMPLTIVDQTGSKWPGSVNVINGVKDNSDLYNEGDVLICPHSVDGLGLEPREAMACGMPVITTNGEPWNELPALERIPATVTTRNVRRPVHWYSPDPGELVRICRIVKGMDIEELSRDARMWAEGFKWTLMAPEFNALVKTGEHKITLPILPAKETANAGD